MFFYAIIDGFIVVLAIFVDDGFIICKYIAIINRISKSFEKEFDITFGKRHIVCWFLNCERP